LAITGKRKITTENRPSSSPALKEAALPEGACRAAEDGSDRTGVPVKETPVRILHVVDSMNAGGLENGVVNVINELDPARFAHVLCAVRELGPNADRLRADRADTICLQKPAGSRFDFGRLASVVRRIRPDVVHCRNWGSIEGVFAARFAGRRPVVYSEHGLEGASEEREVRRRIWLRRIAFETADQVLCVSNELRDHHARQTGYPARRISVIHNGVQTARFRPDATARASIRRDHAIGDSAFWIGSVGRLMRVKDHMTLLQAVDLIDRQTQDWRLTVVGEGPERANLEAFVRASPWRERVNFAGVSARVPEFLNGFDVYALPSINEGLCNSLAEAMACGLPVVATAVGGNPELVEDGRSGLLFPAGDHEALAKLLLELRTSPDRRRELGRQARERILQQFSIETMARNYGELYTGLARPSGLARAVARV
jgi:sugar transferase (PEP-CTERM/EpsH1 system associated)